MPIVNRAVLKGYLERGDKPTQSQFATVLDSMVNIIEDRYLLGLREYDPLKQYLLGDSTIYSNALYECLADTTGAFDPPKWKVIASLGSVVYSGTWSAAANSPTLSDSTGVKGYYYVVTASGTQNLGSGAIEFEIGDWVIYNGSIWQKVDNSQAPVDAADVSFTPNGSITATNVQDAVVQVRDNADAEFLLKADKVTGATANDIALLDASGNLLDSGKQISDFLPSTTDASDIPFTPNGDITATNVQDAIVEVRDDTDAKLFLKADKVIGGVTDDLVKLDAFGNLVDSGKKVADFLPSTTTASSIPFTPNGDITATNVQNAIVEVRDDTDTKLTAKLNLSGGTMTGNLILNANPTNVLGATPKQYVDAADALKLNLAGGTMTGDLILNANPTNVLGATTKQYVDNADSRKTDKVISAPTDDIAVFDATGNLADGGKKLSDYLSKTNTTAYTPTNDFHPATKIYVDNKFAAVPAQVKVVVMPFTFGTIYTTTSGTYTRIPLQVSVPASADVFPGTTTISVKIFADYLTTNGTTTGRVALLDFTDFAGGTITPVSGSDTTLAATSNVWTTLIGPSFTITPGRSYSLVIERTAGTGTVQLEGGSIILVYS